MEDCFPDFNMPRLMDRIRKSIARATKTLMEANWKTIPATMVFVPGSVLPLTLFTSAEAKPPPIAWTIREITSQVQNIQRYRLGRRMEQSRPKTWIKRPRIM